MKRYKKTLNNCKIEVLEEQHFKGQFYKTCYFSVFTISWRFLHFVTVSYISCNLLKVVGTFSWKSFFLRFLMVLLAGWLAGWLDGWLAGWGSQPAQLSQPSQPSPFETPETNKNNWKTNGFGAQPDWETNGFGAQPGLLPLPVRVIKPVGLQHLWFLNGFLLVSGVSNGLGWLGWLSWAGWAQPSSQPAKP